MWDADQGHKLAALSEEAAVQAAVFGPAGDRLVAFKGAATLWDPRLGRRISTLHHDASFAGSLMVSGPAGVVNDAVFSDDGGRIVTASEDGTARVWDAGDGTPIAVLRGHDAPVKTARFSKNGDLILTSADDNTVRLWDATGGAEVTLLPAAFEKAAFSPDGRTLLTTAADGALSLWSVDDGALLHELTPAGASLVEAPFSVDGGLVLAPLSDGSVQIWDAAAGTPRTRLQGHDRRVQQASFNPSGSQVLTSGGDDRRAILWDVATGKPLLVMRHEGALTSAAFSPNGDRLLTTALAADENRIFRRVAYLWDPADGSRIATLTETGSALWSVTFSPDGRLIATGAENGVARLWDCRTGEPLAALPAHADYIASLAFDADGGRLLTLVYDEAVQLVDTARGIELSQFRHEPGTRRALLFPDGSRVLTLSAGLQPPAIWEAASGRQLAALVGHEGFVEDAVISPDGSQVVTWSQLDRTARLWNGESGHLLAVLRRADRVEQVSFSADGSRLLVVSVDGATRLFPVFRAIDVLISHARETVPRHFTAEDRKRLHLADR